MIATRPRSLRQILQAFSVNVAVRPIPSARTAAAIRMRDLPPRSGTPAPRPCRPRAPVPNGHAPRAPRGPATRPPRAALPPLRHRVPTTTTALPPAREQAVYDDQPYVAEPDATGQRAIGHLQKQPHSGRAGGGPGEPKWIAQHAGCCGKERRDDATGLPHGSAGNDRSTQVGDRRVHAQDRPRGDRCPDQCRSHHRAIGATDCDFSRRTSSAAGSTPPSGGLRSRGHPTNRVRRTPCAA